MSETLLPEPKMAAILVTYQCVAQCDECCFSCGPHLKNTTLTFDKIKQFLEQVTEVPSVKMVVFSGGECFVEFSLLKKSIQYAHELGLLTRCVTNGYWGSTIKLAREKVSELKECGLTEINFSTGDSHQQYVPVENVLNATIAATEQGMMTCIAVEENTNKHFKASDFIKHPLYQEYLADTSKEKFLKVMPAVWVSFHTDNIYQYDSTKMDGSNEEGCDGIFDTLALEARGNVMGCCGITVNDVEEFYLGKLGDSSLKEMYAKHSNDFLKIWIFVDGPKKIVEIASQWIHEKPPVFAHKCLYCAYLYNNEELLKGIKDNYYTLRDDVLSRYTDKLIMQRAMVESEVG